MRAVAPITDELRRELDLLPAGQLMILQNCRGVPFTVSGFDKAFRRWAGEAGVIKSPHGLRHARAVAMAEAGASPMEIAAVLGHCTVEKAMGYTRQASRDELAANAFARVNEPGTNVVKPFAKPSQ